MNDEIRKRIDAVRRGEVPDGYIVENHQLRPLDWKYEKIGKYLVAHDEYSNDTERYMLATSSRQGLLPQTDYYNDQRFDETAGGFHVVPEGYVTYRHMSDDDVFKFNVNDLGTPVLVSPEYPVFTTKAELNQSLLIEYLNGTNEFRSFCRAQKKGSTRTRMYFSRLGEFMMPIPPISEQQKIADILSACDRLIALKQNRLEELKQLKKTCLAKMFPRDGTDVPELRFPGFTAPWAQRKLSDLAEIVGGGTPDTNNPAYWDGEIDWYAPAEMDGQRYAVGSVRKITELGLQKSSAKMLPAYRTVLFTSRAGIGKMAILQKSAATNQGFQSLVLREGADPYFIYSMGDKIKDMAGGVASGSTFLEISGKMLGNLEVMIPSIDEQKEIASFFREIDDLITLHQRELEAEQQKKKALMQLLLTGLVRIPD